MKRPRADAATPAPPGTDPERARQLERQDQRRRALVTSLVGKKVSLSTTDFHHVVGRLVELAEDDRLRLFVNNREVTIRRQGVARIHEADPALAEYIK